MDPDAIPNCDNPDPLPDLHPSDQLDPDLDPHQFADDKPKCTGI